MTASAKQLAAEALALLNHPVIPYRLGGTTLEGMDCQGCIKYCCKQIGVTLNYSGSNDMYRNACSWVGTLAEAKAQKKLVPGAVGFIIEHDGGEGEKYRNDGMGNAGHIGIITLSGDVYSVDASSSAGKVRSRTPRDAERVWSHIGWLKGLDYGMTTVEDEISGVYEDEPVATQAQTAIVRTVDAGNLNLRRDPTDKVDNRVGKAPNGATVEVLEARGEWTKVRYSGITAWALTRYLQFDDQASPEPVVSKPTNARRAVAASSRTLTLTDHTARELYDALGACLNG